MHLFDLPCELLNIIFTELPQSTLAKFCLVSHQGYDVCLPHLYGHVHIKFRKQLAQLDKALHRSPLLQQVMKEHTKQLTLTCCQSSFQWLISDAQALWCQRWLPHLQMLTFCDFPILPIERVAPFLVQSSLQILQFRYCNLVCQRQSEPFNPILPQDHHLTSIYQLPASYYFDYNNNNNIQATSTDVDSGSTLFLSSSLLTSSTTSASSRSSSSSLRKSSSSVSSTSTASLSTTITSLHLDWTDFSSTAIDALLHMIPHLTHAFFGANHNRLPNANTMALKALKNNCRHIHSLKVALQQIHPTMISRLITYYGDQLIRLDIRCEDVTTLKAVAQHAKRIRQLSIHAMGALQQQQQQQLDDDTMVTIKDHENDGNDLITSITQNRNTGDTNRNAIQRIVQHCGRLTFMEMISWGIQDIPTVILEVMYRRKRQQLYPIGKSTMTTTWSSTFWPEKVSLALDGELLTEIRNLFV